MSLCSEHIKILKGTFFLRSGRYFAICQQKIGQHKFDRKGHPELSIKNVGKPGALAWTLLGSL